MIEFSKLVQQQFNKMCATGKLFRSNMTGQQVWEQYLSGFENDENPVFRDPESSSHNCNFCKNFIRRYGNIVALDDAYNIMTIFDVDAKGDYMHTAKKLSDQIKRNGISEVFFETFNELKSLPYDEKCDRNMANFKLGIAKNVKRYTKEEAELYKRLDGSLIVKPNEIRTFNHLHMYLPKQFVDMSGKSVESIMGEYRDAKNVFERAMREISLDTLNLVKDLINQGSLLDGQTHLYKIEQIIPLKKVYDSLNVKQRDNWCWNASYKLPLAKFKNELIGVLCTELAEGKELNDACTTWNKRVDPANFMKAVAPITKKQIEDAKRFVEENGYVESFSRRFATIDDIKASEILHVNVGDGSIKSVSIFDNVKSTSTRHKRSEFDGIEEVSIEKFMKDILPNCTSVEAYLSNKHEGNLVSLTTAINKNSKPIFKWSNNYSWTFNGNLAGKSMIKNAVKSRGGNVDGVLNIRLAFPNTTNDYDLHVKEPNRYEIYYGNVRTQSSSSGMLDLDAQGVDGHQKPENRVENIIYTDLRKMLNGQYLVWVNNYRVNDNNCGFTVEIETPDGITMLSYDKMISHQFNVMVATITLNNGEFTVTPHENMLIGEQSIASREMYGLQSEQFHKVNLVCLTPNHWDDNNVGNKHYLFMLDGCKCPTSIRSFHAENLIPELAQHRKVLEVLGNTTMIEPNDKQLSGLGFNATVKDELIVRLQGSFKRVIKIRF